MHCLSSEWSSDRSRQDLPVNTTEMIIMIGVYLEGALKPVQCLHSREEKYVLSVGRCW